MNIVLINGSQNKGVKNDNSPLKRKGVKHNDVYNSKDFNIESESVCIDARLNQNRPIGYSVQIINGDCNYILPFILSLFLYHFTNGYCLNFLAKGFVVLISFKFTGYKVR